MMIPVQDPPSKRRRKRRHASKPSFLSSFLCTNHGRLVLLLAIFLISSSSYPSFTHAKEIEATHEWTLVGENDTVAAGMHVKMDLSTGEKWVKLMDENETDPDGSSDKEYGAEKVSVHGTNLAVSTKHGSVNKNVAEVQVDANGIITTDKNDDAKDDAASKDNYMDHPNYDFEMMHRTLSNLPAEEMERMGGLPELPANYHSKDSTASASPEQRALFEARMKEIWERRQAEIKEFQQDHLADLPQLLKNRIQAMQEYLKDPKAQLQTLDVADNSGGTDNDEFIVGDIVSVLQDLEYHLTDIDMARDFHTLGGWPLLTSLLADAVHEGGNQNDTVASTNNQESQQLSEDDWNKVNLIQAHAAWAIGTTVKNTGEFNPYAITEVEVLHQGSNDPVKTTTLDLVLAQFVASSTAVLDSTTSRPKDEYYDTAMMKVHKTLYALGAMLRANRSAQYHFCADQGPALLETILSGLAEEAHATEIPALPNDTLKVARRLLSLAQDIVMDVTLHASKSDQVDEAVRNAFSSPEWCLTAVRFVGMPRLYETTLQTIQQLAPFCRDQWDLTNLKLQVENPAEHVSQRWLPEDLDDEIRKDRMELLEAAVTAIQGVESNTAEEL